MSRKDAKPNRFVILPCAGSGKRMGGDQPKFLLDLGGISVLGLTLKRLHDCDAVDQILLVLSKDFLQTFREKYLNSLAHYKISWLVEGGKERQDSIWHALQVLSGEDRGFEKISHPDAPPALQAKKGDLVAVHDAVRPFANAHDFSRVFNAAQSHGASLLAIATQDTIKECRDLRVQKTLERKNLYQAQTPQAFEFRTLCEAYQNAYQSDLLCTDDASLVEALNRPVQIVPGSPGNLKVTTPKDLQLARMLWEIETNEGNQKK